MAAVLIAAAVASIVQQTRHFGLVGWDTYPLILASRVRTPEDVVDLFTKHLMGDASRSSYYRPVLNVSLAVDHAIGGLEPQVYQVSNAVLFGACAAALYVLFLHLSTGGTLGAGVALVAFLAHPASFEVIPVVSRRPDLLCALFVLLALVAQARAAARGRERPALLPACFGLLAMASKETGFIAAPLAALTALVCLPAATLRARAAGTAREMIPWAAIAIAILVIRIAVVGRIGDPTDAVGRVPDTIVLLVRHLVLVRPGMLEPIQAIAPILGLVFCVAIAGGSNRRAGHREICAGAWRPALVGVTWVGLVGLMYSMAGAVQAWYVTIPLAGAALLLGAAAQACRDALRLTPGIARATGVVGLVLAVVVVAQWGRLSPHFHHYAEWSRATRVTDRYLENLRAAIERTPDGETLHAETPPPWIHLPGPGPRLLGAAVLTPYSVRAWCDLVFPDRRIRVRRAATRRIQEARADELLILLHDGAPAGRASG